MIVFETPGLIDPRAFTTLGLSAKPNSQNPIGYFGTGLKYAIAVLCRLGAEPVVFIGEDKHTFQKRRSTFRGKEYEQLRMKSEKSRWLKPRYQDLPFTTEYGRNWQAWQAYRELEANTRDEGGHTSEAVAVGGKPDCTRIVVELAAFDEAYSRRDEIFLPTGDRTPGLGVQVLGGETKSLYWRGLKVYETGKPCLYRYNFLTHLVLTEDRTLAGEFFAKTALASHVLKSEDEDFIEHVITAGEAHWEHNLEFDRSQAPSAAFHRVMLRHPKHVSGPVWGYYGHHDPRVVPTKRDLLDDHPLPWHVDGERVMDAKGQPLFEAPYGYLGKWPALAQFVVDQLNPPTLPLDDVEEVEAVVVEPAEEQGEAAAPAEDEESVS